MNDPEAPRTPRRAPYILAFLGAAAVAGALSARPLLARGLERWASAQGVQLRFSGLTLRAGQLALEGVVASAAGFERVTLESPEAKLYLETFRPKYLHLTAPRVRFSGTRDEAIAQWKTLNQRAASASLPHQGLGDLPLRFDAFEVVAQAPDDPQPWLSIRRFDAKPRQGRYLLEVDGASAQGVALADRQRFLWTPSGAGGTLEIGEKPGAFPVKIRVEPRDEGLALRLDIARFALAPLVDLKLLPAEARKVEVEGVVEAKIPRDKVIDGTAKLSLWGYTPPHPPDVDALVAAEKTTMQATFHADLAQSTVAVPSLAVTSGRLSLAGSGSGSLRPTASQPLAGASFRGHLGGSLPCSAVAKASAARRVGGLAGDLLGDLADLALQGNVQVSVQLEVDPQKPPSTYVKPTITARCGAGL